MKRIVSVTDQTTLFHQKYNNPSLACTWTKFTTHKAVLTDLFNRYFVDILQSKLPNKSLNTWIKRGLAMTSLSVKKLYSTIRLQRFIVSCLRLSNDNLLSFSRLNSGSLSMVFQTLCLYLTTSSPPSINTFIWNQSKEARFRYLSNGPGGKCFSISSMRCSRCDSLSESNSDIVAALRCY